MGFELETGARYRQVFRYMKQLKLIENSNYTSPPDTAVRCRVVDYCTERNEVN